MDDEELDDEEVVLEAVRLDCLRFVIPSNDKPRVFWAPRPADNYSNDGTLGREYALAVLPMLTCPGGHQLPRWIVMDMVKHGDAHRDAGLIVGMMGEIGRMLEGGGE